jgi:hypothetical protein
MRTTPALISLWAALILGIVGLTLAVLADGCRIAVVAIVALFPLALLEFYALIFLSTLGGEPF